MEEANDSLGRRTSRTRPGNRDALPFAGRMGANQTLGANKVTAAEVPFAGRIGGNQEFIVTDLSSQRAQLVLKKTADAAPILSIRDSLDLQGFTQPLIWKAAMIECWGESVLPA